jgi:hypothetical protein
VDFQPYAIFLEPTPDRRILVIGGVVLNQMRSLGIIPAGQLLQKFQISRRIEHACPMICELSTIDFNRPKYLYALPLPGDWNLRLAPDGSPCLINRRILAETGFVFKNQRRPFARGFFLDSDTCNGAICPVPPD